VEVNVSTLGARPIIRTKYLTLLVLFIVIFIVITVIAIIMVILTMDFNALNRPTFFWLFTPITFLPSSPVSILTLRTFPITLATIYLNSSVITACGSKGITTLLVIVITNIITTPHIAIIIMAIFGP